MNASSKFTLKCKLILGGDCFKGYLYKNRIRSQTEGKPNTLNRK